MPRPVEEMSAAQIEAELKNHKAWRQDGKPYSQQNAARYQELLAARNTREGWHFETSRGAIEAAARRGEFLSYADLAKANRLEWSLKVRFSVGDHLWDLDEWGDYNDLPMLSAIVVNKEGVETGKMAAETLKGFIAAAEALGKDVSDPEALLKAEQAALFAIFAPTDPTPE